MQTLFLHLMPYVLLPPLPGLRLPLWTIVLWLLEPHPMIALVAIVDEAQCRGLSLNFDAGKTELLVHWRGSGTRSVKEMISANGGTITVTRDGPPILLRCTFSYKHLGTWVQNNAIHHRDSRARLTEARKAWGPLLRPVFRKRNIGVSTKRQIFEALVYSRLLYNARVWRMDLSRTR